MKSVQISIRNKSNYFVPDKDKVSFDLLSPYSHRFKMSKQYGYYQRLYWEFQSCMANDGQVFFYTLTYSDKNVPFYEGIPCFDYKDLRSFLNGAFKKYLVRSYHCRFRFFVSAELGDGAGKRGFENNPHYHCLFFLDRDPKCPESYIKITPKQFCHLVKYYWQGFDDDVAFRDFKECKFGIAKPGDNLGLVDNFRAVSYVVKYVTKDVGLVKKEPKLKKILFERYFEKVYHQDNVRLDFLKQHILPRYSVYYFDDLPDKEAEYKSLANIVSSFYPGFDAVEITDKEFLNSFQFFIDVLGCEADFLNYCTCLSEDMVRVEINNFRNRFCNKCRISQHVGEYALNFVDKTDPVVKVVTKKGIEYKKIGLYYYRKLYCDIVKDPMGNPVYVLNKDGIDYKVSRLDLSISNIVNKLKGFVPVMTPNLFYDLQKEDLIPSFYDYEKFLELFNEFNLHLYAEYKMVYENRFFSMKMVDGVYQHPKLDVQQDYRRFLEPSFYLTEYCPNGVSDFLKSDNYLISYENHRVFSNCIGFFRVLDNLSVYFASTKDNCQKEIYEENKRVKSLFDKLKLNNYYSSFKF